MTHGAGRMADWPVWFRFAVAVLATWRVVHLVAREDGPFDVIVRLRVRAGTGALGRLMDCPYCLSLWVAVPFAFSLAQTALAWCAGWLAVSGGAAVIEKCLERRAGSSSIGGV